MYSLDSPAAKAAFTGITHIYTDLDGTMLAPGGRLLTNHEGEPSLELAEALVLLKKAGLEIILVTGRDVAQCTEIMRLTNLDQFIAEMGCIVQFGYGATAQKSYILGEWGTERIGQSEGLTPYEMIEQSGILEILTSTYQGKIEKHPLPGHREVTYLLRGHVDASSGGEVDRLLAGFDLPLQLMDNGIIHFKNHTLTDIDELHVYHLMPRNTGKGQAVAADMVAKGLVPAQALAIGDAPGDIPMGASTGSFVLVSNKKDSALEELALATVANPEALFIAAHPTADGWVEFAHALLAAKATLP